jgi:GntR family transcriptional repressor for pyruvate dehydrogenase complex
MTSVDSAKTREPERLSDKVAEQLLVMIANGSLSPGQRLPGERQLAEQMGVSRVSVRAALQRLKTQGFLAAVQGGGTRVISSDATMDPGLSQLVRLNQENLHDLAELRMVMEVWAARRAAVKASQEDITEMAAILAAMEAGNSRGRRKGEDDIRFHLAIARASGSAIYMHIVGVIRDILRQNVEHHRYDMFDTPAEDELLLDHHRAIYHGIRARDPEAAAAAMQEHLTWVVRRYEEARKKAALSP